MRWHRNRSPLIGCSSGLLVTFVGLRFWTQASRTRCQVFTCRTVSLLIHFSSFYSWSCAVSPGQLSAISWSSEDDRFTVRFWSPNGTKCKQAQFYYTHPVWKNIYHMVPPLPSWHFYIVTLTGKDNVKVKMSGNPPLLTGQKLIPTTTENK